MNSAYLLIGGNIGNRLDNLIKAEHLIEERCGTILQSSSIYETAAWGNEEQPPFYNRALYISTNLSPENLIVKILNIETEMGRQRNEVMGPRTIDIDILFYDGLVMETDRIVIPHPRLHLRKFVLVPLDEIAPAYRHPLLKKTVEQMLEECPDSLDVHKISGSK